MFSKMSVHGREKREGEKSYNDVLVLKIITENPLILEMHKTHSYHTYGFSFELFSF